MRRPSVPEYALLALLVVATGVITPTVVAAATESPDAVFATPGNDTVSQIEISGSDSEPNERQLVSGDLSSALAGEQERLTAQINARQFERDFDAAPGSDAQIEAVRMEINRVEERAVALRDSRKDAVHAYTNGNIDATELVRELTRIRSAAAGLSDRLDQVEQTVESSDELSVSNDISVRLSGVKSHLITLTGPVTDHLAAVTDGSEPARLVSVETSGDGVVLGMINDDQYIQETTVWSSRADSGPNQFASGDEPPTSVAYARATELYPWASTNTIQSPSINGIGDTPVYVITFTHSHGEVISHLDGRTTDVFYEVQRLHLSQIPTETIATNSTDSLSMTVTATFRKGPMAVTVTDDSGQPVEAATIVADDERLGSTDTDGQFWLVDTGQRERITARTADGETISAVVEH